jgi:hypothetical protein
MGNFSCSKLGKLCLIMLVYVGSEGPSPLGKVQCVWDKPTVLMWLRTDRLGKMRHGNQKSEAKKNIVLKNSFIWSMHAFLCVLIWFCFIRPHWAVAHSGKTPSLTLLTWLLCPENCASIFFFLEVLGFELRTSRLLGRRSYCLSITPVRASIS